MKSDYGLQFINNILLLKSSLYTRRECQEDREYEDDSEGGANKYKENEQRTKGKTLERGREGAVDHEVS